MGYYNEMSVIYSEVYEIINNMDKKYIEKIPKKMLELIESERNLEYEPNIKANIPLEQQNLNKKTLAFLAMLNLKYWCEDENHKKELVKLYTQNDQKVEKNLNEIYDPNGIFSNGSDNIEGIIDNDNEDTELIVYEKLTFLKKIVNKIKNFFIKRR